MTRMGWVVTLLMLVACTIASAQALDPVKGAATLFGSNDLVGLRYEWLGEKTGIGPELFWQNGVVPGEAEAVGLGGFGRYNVAEEQPLDVFVATIPTTVYVGARVGVLYNLEDEGDRFSGTAAVLMGTSFGDKRTRIGFEVWAGASSDLWKEFANFDPDTGVTLTLTRCW